MLVLTLICFLVFIILYIISYNYQRKFINSLNKKEHPLKIFYSIVAFLRHIVFKKQENLSQSARLLSYRKGAAAILCFLSFLVLILFNELRILSKPAEIVNNAIERPKLGEGDKTVDAVYRSEKEDNEIKIHVSEKLLQGKQRETLLERVEQKLDTIILDQNLSAGEIRSDLSFPKTVKGTNVKISYKINNKDLIHRDGTISFENISKEGNKASVLVSLSYEETTREKLYEFQIYPSTNQSELVLSDQIQMELLDGDKASRDSNTFQLPSKVGEVELHWEANRNENSLVLFIMGIVVTVLMPFAMERKRKEKEDKRMDQMKKDYPEIISKFQLLLTAGMTTKGAWERIVIDYLQSKEVRSKKESSLHFIHKGKGKQQYQRVAYEEMVITRREQELGIAEEVTYERFGKRCRSISYVRFATILSQNLRTGSRMVAQLLEQEARDAFGERKEQAKQLGEKASTKLLGPTMGMLLIIMVIIFIPAFMNF